MDANYIWRSLLITSINCLCPLLHLASVVSRVPPRSRLFDLWRRSGSGGNSFAAMSPDTFFPRQRSPDLTGNPCFSWRLSASVHTLGGHCELAVASVASAAPRAVRSCGNSLAALPPDSPSSALTPSPDRAGHPRCPRRPSASVSHSAAVATRALSRLRPSIPFPTNVPPVGATPARPRGGSSSPAAPADVHPRTRLLSRCRRRLGRGLSAAMMCTAGRKFACRRACQRAFRLADGFSGPGEASPASRYCRRRSCSQQFAVAISNQASRLASLCSVQGHTYHVHP